jgi:histidine triad (HIT) family protein/ATP adenylyltransferase
VPPAERVPFDFKAYDRRSRGVRCFVCAFLDGDPDYNHELLYDDGEHAAFLARDPVLTGYALVVPKRHVEDVVNDLTPEAYLRLQSAVHVVARAVSDVVRPERTYLLSLGSMQGQRPRPLARGAAATRGAVRAAAISRAHARERLPAAHGGRDG